MEKVTEVNKAAFYNALGQVFEEGVVLTAREASIEVFEKFRLGDGTRQAVHPRITEMVKKHLLYHAGKKIDFSTNKRVTAYSKYPIDKEVAM